MTLDEYTKRLTELMTEASQYGLATVAVVIDFDPISNTETTDVLHRRAGPITISGAAAALMDYARELSNGGTS